MFSQYYNNNILNDVFAQRVNSIFAEDNHGYDPYGSLLRRGNSESYDYTDLFTNDSYGAYNSLYNGRSSSSDYFNNFVSSTYNGGYYGTQTAGPGGYNQYISQGYLFSLFI